MPVLALVSLWMVLAPDLLFRPWFTSHGVEVEIARPAQTMAPWLRGTAELSVAAGKVEDVLTDYSRYREIFAPAIKKAEVLEAGEASARIHFVWPYPFPLRNRDAVVLYRSEKRDGRFVLSWKSAAAPGDPREGIRIQNVAGETVVQALGPERCRVTYTYLGELGGKFPSWAEEKAWREEPVQYIRAIQRALKLAGSPGWGRARRAKS